MVYDNGALKLVASTKIRTNAQLAAAISTFNTSPTNTTLTIGKSFNIEQALTISGAAELTIKSEAGQNYTLTRGSAADTGGLAVTGNLFYCQHQREADAGKYNHRRQ